MTVINQLHFFNHASFAIERDSEILLIDPWYEGTAFHNGWALLDASTSDASVIKWLKQSRKKIFIWYSHEHSDHLSMSFLKSISKEKIDLTVIFQKTLDGRVNSFLNKLGLNVIDVNEGVTLSLGERFDITTWPYHGGDSFCLIKSEDISLLNINDCYISTEYQAQRVKSKYSSLAPNLDILLTQFGYANWVGNESDRDQRIKLANHKFDRIFIQNKILCPTFIIPFASFVYFCHHENFYLNDAQNSPDDVLMAKQLEPIKNNIFFLKPYDKISLDSINLVRSQFENLSSQAIKHWGHLKETIKPLQSKAKEVESQELKDIYLNYRKRMTLNFIFLPQVFEVITLIKPIRILISDIDKVARLSYLKGIIFKENSNDWHISLSSEVFSFIFKNEFGFNTTHVNGRFRLGKGKFLFDVVKFFIIQDFYKQGFGISHPIKSANFFMREVIRFLTKKLFKPTLPQP
jgi:UDP-MurNAc hydroxylase